MKLRELMRDVEILSASADMNMEILSMKEAGISADIVEDGTTFEENAMIKATAISKMAGCLVLADDSGLEVDYMDKMPGIMSARWMGEDTSYTIKNAKIIENLDGVRAKFPEAYVVKVSGSTVVRIK